MFSYFFEWQELIWLHRFVSYEYLRIMIWHGLNFELLKNLENLENFENFENGVFWTFLVLLTSDLGLDSLSLVYSKFQIQTILQFLDKCTSGITPQWVKLCFLIFESQMMAAPEPGIYIFKKVTLQCTVGFWCQTIHKNFLQRIGTIFGLKMMVKSGLDKLF